MKRKSIIFFLTLFIGYNSRSQSTRHCQFNNTVWVSRITSDCIDTLRFGKYGRVRSYNCEINYTSKGTFIIEGKILVLTILEDSDETPEKWRYKYLLRNKILVPMSSEQMREGKWQKERVLFDSSYYFTRIK